jgi:hypothetical protein
MIDVVSFRRIEIACMIRLFPKPIGAMRITSVPLYMSLRMQATCVSFAWSPGIHREERCPRTNGPHEYIESNGSQTPLPSMKVPHHISVIWRSEFHHRQVCCCIRLNILDMLSGIASYELLVFPVHSLLDTRFVIAGCSSVHR